MLMMRCAFAIVGAALAIGLAPAAGAESPQGTEMVPTLKQSKQEIGDWVVACTEVSKERKSCVLSQTLLSAKSKRTISVFSIGLDRNGKLTGALRLPVGMNLAAGVVVGLEKQSPFNVAYATCFRVGCVAPFELTEPLLGRVQKAAKITAVVQTGAENPVTLSFSMRGFPKAYETYLKEAK